MSTSELYAILQLRNEVFVVEQDCPYQDLDDADREALHLFIVENNTVIAYSRLFPPNVKYADSASIGRVVVKQNCRDRNIGKWLMQQSIKEIQSIYQASSITISAQSYLLRFYRALGFVEIGEEYLEDDIPHYKMILTF